MSVQCLRQECRDIFTQRLYHSNLQIYAHYCTYDPRDSEYANRPIQLTQCCIQFKPFGTKRSVPGISISFKYECCKYNTQRVLSIMPRIPKISVGIQMERSVSVSSDRNIRDHFWRWSTYFDWNIPIEIRRTIFDKPILCPN